MLLLFCWHSSCFLAFKIVYLEPVMIGWTIDEWAEAYRNGANPAVLLRELRAGLNPADPAWIYLIDPIELERQAKSLVQRRQRLGDAALPLFGVPFAVKDNIDVAGMQTTAACPAFAYEADTSAYVVQRLQEAGAIVIGKTNLDQFATGLVGARSPYGTVPNTFNSAYISGGSSSGSASVVARGIVPFALGTDTAGSGRVPAGLNNIVGLKPTVGALSSSGMVPACRTLDCISVFATTVSDAAAIYDLAVAYDSSDSYSRLKPPSVAYQLPAAPRLGIPAEPEFFGDEHSRAAFDEAIAMAKSLGAQCIPLDFTLLDRVTALLYDGPWVAERLAAIEEFFDQQADAIDPIVRGIILRAKAFSASDTFRAQYRLAQFKRAAEVLMSSVDALFVPTAPTHYRIDVLVNDPVRLNSNLGKYTNFVNLLDWSALALPAGFRADGLPFGMTLIGPAWSEVALAKFGVQWQERAGLPRGAIGLPYHPAPQCASLLSQPGFVRIAVVGAHLSGMPLNHQLTDRKAVLVETVSTASCYRLFELKGTQPPKPGLIRSTSGAPIQLELWDMPSEYFGSFVDLIGSPLGIGTIELIDGRTVKGFICEVHALANAVDITSYGGWRNYLKGQSTQAFPAQTS